LSSSSPSKGETHFLRTDVSSYTSLLSLFSLAWEKYSRIDICISNAGVAEAGNWFDTSSLEDIKTEPTLKTINVNLTGTIFFSRIAAAYLKESHKATAKEGSLLLVSSTAGFKETPGLPVYTASKHGVLGLVRSLRPCLRKTHQARVNAICPWMTDTGMVDGIRGDWVAEKLPVNTPEMVARLIVEVAVGRPDSYAEACWEEKGIAGYNGRAVFVEGGRGWDIEEGINANEEEWLGKDVSRTVNRGQVVLGDGTDWIKPSASS
jgi:NAD(P)-dependent dehydrogenase (short-subunit alcohol dehydrogenase family)